MGETEAKFTFGLTNVSKETVTISGVHTSCGCTVAQLPSQPWVLKPGDHGEIGVTVDLRGKSGNLIKTATVSSSVGSIPLMVQISVPRIDPKKMPMTENDRTRNLQVAAVDRQAVFRGECVTCHVIPTIGKVGKELYVAACGVCHEGEHRASMVPNLRALNKPTDAAYWNQWISEGRPGSLMPAFLAKNGGILSSNQVSSLVAYLSGPFQSEPKTPATPGAAPAVNAQPARSPVTQ
jgi:mono/diheme cytochrome c family protein